MGYPAVTRILYVAVGEVTLYHPLQKFVLIPNSISLCIQENWLEHCVCIDSRGNTT
jgi:hypothetical protein